jgi:hypothetical protein
MQNIILSSQIFLNALIRTTRKLLPTIIKGLTSLTNLRLSLILRMRKLTSINTAILFLSWRLQNNILSSRVFSDSLIRVQKTFMCCYKRINVVYQFKIIPDTYVRISSNLLVFTIEGKTDFYKYRQIFSTIHA